MLLTIPQQEALDGTCKLSCLAQTYQAKGPQMLNAQPAGVIWVGNAAEIFALVRIHGPGSPTHIPDV